MFTLLPHASTPVSVTGTYPKSAFGYTDTLKLACRCTTLSFEVNLCSKCKRQGQWGGWGFFSQCFQSINSQKHSQTVVSNILIHRRMQIHGYKTPFSLCLTNTFSFIWFDISLNVSVAWSRCQFYYENYVLQEKICCTYWGTDMITIKLLYEIKFWIHSEKNGKLKYRTNV